MDFYRYVKLQLNTAIIPVSLFLMSLLLASALTAFIDTSPNVIEGLFGLICHQKPDRCYQLFGKNSYLCARCFSFYLGMLLVSIAFVVNFLKFNKTVFNYFWLLNLPLVMDGLSQYIGWRESNNVLRTVTGLLSGIACAVPLFQFYLTKIPKRIVALAPMVVIAAAFIYVSLVSVSSSFGALYDDNNSSHREQLRGYVNDAYKADAQRDAGTVRSSGSSDGNPVVGFLVCCLPVIIFLIAAKIRSTAQHENGVNAYAAVKQKSDDIDSPPYTQPYPSVQAPPEQAAEIKDGFDEKWSTLVKYDESTKNAVELLDFYGNDAINELKKVYRATNDYTRLPTAAKLIAKEFKIKNDLIIRERDAQAELQAARDMQYKIEVEKRELAEKAAKEIQDKIDAENEIAAQAAREIKAKIYAEKKILWMKRGRWALISIATICIVTASIYYPLRYIRNKSMDEAVSDYSKGNYSKALACWKKYAEKGDAAAQRNLGKMYYEGTVVTQNYQEAEKWLRKSAEQGYANAQSILCGMYYSGKGVVKDYKEAEKWGRKAAEQGNASAQTMLCSMYYTGEGIAKDYKESGIWCRKASVQGDATAQFILGGMYYYGNGVVKDYVESAKWFRKAAEQGDIAAQVFLAGLYLDGTGVTQDDNEAMKLVAKPAEQGDKDAENVIGMLYFKKNNYKEAENFFRKAAEQGVSGAQYNLGVMFLKGDGVAINYSEAEKWFRKAVSQGHSKATQALQEVEQKQRESELEKIKVEKDKIAKRESILFKEAEAYLNKGKTSRAKVLFAKLAKNGKDPEWQRLAQQALDSLASNPDKSTYPSSSTAVYKSPEDPSQINTPKQNINSSTKEWSTPEALKAFGKPGDTVNPALLEKHRKQAR